MINIFKKNLPVAFLSVFFVLYSSYFSYFSISRMQSLHSHYFDLGIMHQASYNSYVALREGDFGRFLEITDPHESMMQVNRMAIHTDVILGLIGALYFIYSGPEMLLILQSIIVSIGGIFIFLIVKELFKKKYSNLIALTFSLSFYLYTPLQKAVSFDFHAITLSPTFILGYFYFFLKKNYFLQFVFAGLTILTKEQIGLVMVGFSMLQIVTIWQKFKSDSLIRDKQFMISLIIGGISFLWVYVALNFIIPFFRGGEHFGSDYYLHLKDNPLSFFTYTLSSESFKYMYQLLSPLGFLSLLSPLHFLVASPEFGINILSANSNMRNIFFHYDTGATAIIFISAIYGGRNLVNFLNIKKISSLKICNLGEKILITLLITFSGFYSLFTSSLPWSTQKDVVPFSSKANILSEVYVWQRFLKDEVKVSTSGRLAPFFTSRRYFYDFAGGYTPAEFVLIYTPELNNSFQRKENAYQYSLLKQDRNFILFYKFDTLEVYKRMNNI